MKPFCSHLSFFHIELEMQMGGLRFLTNRKWLDEYSHSIANHLGGTLFVNFMGAW